MTGIDGIIRNGRHVIIPEILKAQVLDQLHINHTGREKTKFLAYESIYWINIYNDIENVIRLYYTSHISADTIKGQDDTS